MARYWHSKSIGNYVAKETLNQNLELNKEFHDTYQKKKKVLDNLHAKARGNIIYSPGDLLIFKRSTKNFEEKRIPAVHENCKPLLQFVRQCSTPLLNMCTKTFD